MNKLLIVLSVLALCSARAASPDGAEFTKMRMDFAKKPGALLTWVADDQRQALLNCYKTDKKKFVEEGVTWLEKCPVDAKVQLMLGYALSELGKARESIKYRYIYYGLMQSIIANRDGSSKESAFTVISVDEEYNVCSYLGASVLLQELDGFYDVLSVSIGEQKMKLYFDASIPLKALDSELKAGKKEQK